MYRLTISHEIHPDMLALLDSDGVVLTLRRAKQSLRFARIPCEIHAAERLLVAEHEIRQFDRVAVALRSNPEQMRIREVEMLFRKARYTAPPHPNDEAYFNGNTTVSPHPDWTAEVICNRRKHSIRLRLRNRPATSPRQFEGLLLAALKQVDAGVRRAEIVAKQLREDEDRRLYDATETSFQAQA